MAPISIKGLRSKDPLLQACGFYKPFEVDLYDSYAYEHKSPNIEDCFALKKKIKELIKQGRLQRFLGRDRREDRPPVAYHQRPPTRSASQAPTRGDSHDNWRVEGGTSHSSRKAYARQIHDVLVTQKTGKIPRLEDLPITFTEEDARKVFHPHDNALVVSLEIAGYSKRCVLVDNGKIGLTTLRTTFHKEENEGQLRLNLDLLDETKEKVAQRITLYQGKVARYYNTKVKLQRFEVGDRVLRKVTQATKDSSQGKLSPNWEDPYKVVQYYKRGTYHLEDRHGKKLPHPWNAEHLKKYYP
uniref:Reverse transcriptase domain-containing protein n=1 Tax=Fagus sylvatica TaxID=28930 RepID=A0A2N9J600_FAGSY